MRLLLLFLCTLFVGCSQTEIAGGTGTETTNGMIILTSAGLPAENAQVSIIDGATWYDSILVGTSPAVELITASENGVIEPKSTTGTRTVQVQWGDEVGVATGLSDTLILSEGITIRGSAIDLNRILIGGTSFEADVINDSFVIHNIPVGLYSFWSISDKTIHLQEQIQIEKDTSVDIHQNNEQSLLFDGFQGGFSQNPLQTVSTGVLWYLVSDSVHQSFKNGVWTIAENTSTGNSTISASELDKAVRADIFLGDKAPYPFSGMGVSLFGPTYQQGYNLTNMDSISLRLRGEGNVELVLESDLHDSLNISHYRALIPLSENWETVVVSVNDLHLLTVDNAYESSTPWISGADNIKRLELLWRSQNNSIPQDYWIEIDEIRFMGITFPY